MNSSKSSAPLLVIIACALLWLSVPQAQATIRARLIHAASAYPALDIYVNGALALSGLAAGEASAYLNVSAGASEVSGFLEGTTTRLFASMVALDHDASTVMISPGAAEPVAIFADDLSPLEFGMARLLLVNMLRAHVSLDVSAAQTSSLSGVTLAPGAAIGPIELAAGEIEFSLLSSNGDGDFASHDLIAALPAATSSILFVHGALNRPQLLQAQAAADAGEASGRIRFVHAVQGAAPVDLRIDDRMIVPALAFAKPSAHIALPVGSHRLSLSLGDTALASLDLEVSAGGMQTVLVIGSPGSLTVQAYPDSLRDLNETSALVKLINAVPYSSVNRLRLGSGAIVAADVGFGEDGGAAQIVPGRQSMTMTLDIGEERGTIDVPAQSFYAGSYYNLIALAGSAFAAPRLLIAETSMMRRITASPAPPVEAASDDDQAIVAEDESSAEAATAESAPATAQLEDAPEPGADGELGKSAEAESLQDEISAAESEAPVETGSALVARSPYAVVDLLPSARLQLRQYPTREALSLGLLPGESKIIVLGRRGLTDFLPGDMRELPVDLSGYTADPAAALYPIQDLPPADTWLFVVYQTDDGGALVGWVNALYLQVFDEAGERQRLASLPMVRQNRAGSSLNTGTQSTDDMMRGVVGEIALDPGAMLHLRREPDANSQSLALIPAGTKLSISGITENTEWLRASYQAVDGWISAHYVALLLRGRRYDRSYVMSLLPPHDNLGAPAA